MVYGPEKLNDHLNDQLSETPKLTAAINTIKKESWETINSVHELMSSHFLNKLKNNPDMIKKILDIINKLNPNFLTNELKQLRNYLNEILAKNESNKPQNNQTKK